MTTNVYGNSTEIQRLISQINQTQSRVGSAQSRINSLYGRLEDMQRRLDQAWGSTRWNGPERSSADSAFQATRSYLGRARGGVGMARSYIGRINSPLESCERALRSFLNRLN